MRADSAWPAPVTRALAASPAPEIQVGTPFYVSQTVAKAIKSLSEAVGGWGMVIAPATEAQVIWGGGWWEGTRGHVLGWR